MKEDKVFGAGFLMGSLSGIAGVLAIIWFKNKLNEKKLASSTESNPEISGNNQIAMGVRG